MLERIVNDYLIFCDPSDSIVDKAMKIRSRIYTNGGTTTANIATNYSRDGLLEAILAILEKESN